MLEALRASHTDEFTLITTDDDVLGVDELFKSLVGANNSAPGLVVVHFRETHHRT